jgi:hypothetical protein
MSYGLQVKDSTGKIVLDLGYAPFDFIETLILSPGSSGTKTYSEIYSGSVAMIFLLNVSTLPQGTPPIVDSIGNKVFWDIPSSQGGDITVGVYRGELI